MRFGENKTDLSVAALWLVIGGEVFHIEGQPGRQVLCLGNVTLNVRFANDWLVRYRSYTCSRMSQPGELFGSRASRANRSSTTQSCFTAGDRICNITVTILDLLTVNFFSPTWNVRVSVLSFLLTARCRQLLSSQDISSSFCRMLRWIWSMIDAMQSLVKPGYVQRKLPT